jgi:hypothetical protein
MQKCIGRVFAGVLVLLTALEPTAYAFAQSGVSEMGETVIVESETSL